jgi:hypothetical protein
VRRVITDSASTGDVEASVLQAHPDMADRRVVAADDGDGVSRLR